MVSYNMISEMTLCHLQFTLFNGGHNFMFKTIKTQFAIRKLKKGAAAVLLCFGILGGAAAQTVSAATEEIQTEQVETPASEPQENTEKTSEINNEEQTTSAANIEQNSAPTQDSAPATEEKAQETTVNSPENNPQDSEPTVQPTQATSPTVEKTEQNTAANSANNSGQTSAPANNQEQNKQAPVQPSAPIAPAAETKTTQTTAASSNKQTETKIEMAKKEEVKKEQNATKQTTIKNDQDLKDFGFNAEKLDKENILGIAGGFHIFSKDVILNAHTNGNFAAGKLEANVDFGSNGSSPNHSSGDVYYIESGKLHPSGNGFNNPNDYIVLGNDFAVKVENGQVFVNGQRQDHVKPEEIKQIQGYINMAEEFDKLSIKSDKFQKEETTPGVTIDFTDQNNRYIQINQSQIPQDTKVIYVNIADTDMATNLGTNTDRPIYIKGLDFSEDAPAVVINVIGENKKLDLSCEVKIEINGSHLPNSESHAYPNKLLWNFGTNVEEININSGRFMGSILATNAAITARVNVDGNIVGSKVVIQGGETHRWDLVHPPIEEVEMPEQPTSPQPTNPEQPTDPIIPSNPTMPENPTTSEEPTAPVVPEEPTSPINPENPTSPTNPITPEEPTSPVLPEEVVTPTAPHPTEEAEQTSKPEETVAVLPEETTLVKKQEKEIPKDENEITAPLSEKVTTPVAHQLKKTQKVSPKIQKEFAKVVPTSTKITEQGQKIAVSQPKTETATSIVIANDENALPQTGENKKAHSSFIGLIALTLSTALIGLGLKKKKDR